MRRIANQDIHFMSLALEKAREGIVKGQSPFAACIVRGEQILSCEHNVVWETTDSTMHAEVHAIRIAERKLSRISLAGCTTYSTTEPCPMCFSAIHWAKIDRIVFGSTISDARRAGFSELTIPNQLMKQLGGAPVAVHGGVLKAECQQLLNDWKTGNTGRVY